MSGERVARAAEHRGAVVPCLNDASETLAASTALMATLEHILGR
jgi:hypothetical protein